QVLVARYADLAAELEEVVLDLQEHRRDRIGQRLGEQHADDGVELVDVAHGDDAGIVLARARTVAQSRGAVIAGARRDAAQSLAHVAILVIRSRTWTPARRSTTMRAIDRSFGRTSRWPLSTRNR